MQHLSEKWLRLLNYYWVGSCFVYLIFYAYFAIAQGTITVTGHDVFGASITTASFALGCVVYNLILLRLIKKTNLWLAYLISLVLFGIFNSAGAEVALTTVGSYMFIFNNYLLVFAAVAYGPIVSLFAIGIIGIVYGMTVAGTTTPTLLGIVGDSIGMIVRVLGTVGLLYVFRNKYITDGKQNPENYIERYFVKNEVVKLLTDSISDGVIIIDQTGIIKSINPGAGRMLGMDRKDMIDLDYHSILKLQTLQHKELDATTEPVASTLKQTKPTSQELILILHDGSETFTDINVSPIIDPQNSALYGAVIILRDVTQKKKEEAARSEFISTASHEMRTPVAAIEGYIALALNKNVATIDEKARTYLNKAHMSTEHLGRLFQDLLVSAKAEDGRLANHPSVIEMGQYLEQLAEDLRIITTKKGLELEFVTGSADDNALKGGIKVIRPLYYAYADPDRLREVITNLFDNAVKYTATGKITIGLTGNESVVQFFVQDTGAGIPIEDVPHLFQKFYRVDNSATRTTGGTGLGLFICRKILELYQGRIWVESEQGKGSTFFVNLPRLSSMKAEGLKKQEFSNQPVTAQTPTTTPPQ